MLRNQHLIDAGKAEKQRSDDGVQSGRHPTQLADRGRRQAAWGRAGYHLRMLKHREVLSAGVNRRCESLQPQNGHPRCRAIRAPAPHPPTDRPLNISEQFTPLRQLLADCYTRDDCPSQHIDHLDGWIADEKTPGHPAGDGDFQSQQQRLAFW